MTESLLSFSEVLLFGRRLRDIKIDTEIKIDHMVDLVTRQPVEIGAVLTITEIDGVTLAKDQKILVRKNSAKENGIYTVVEVAAGSSLKLDDRKLVERNDLVKVEDGKKFKGSIWRQKDTVDSTDTPALQSFKRQKRLGSRVGKNALLDEQFGEDANLARIYGFAYEGTYYELPEPVIYLVHGNGESATNRNKPGRLASRAPNDPSLGGVAAADYQIANDIRVWHYDKADYTVRMDVMTGQFEQVLLDIYFGFDSPAVGGARVSGARVSGARVSGARVSGARVSGARVSGARARGSDD